MTQRYDRIGHGYADHRIQEPSWVAQIRKVLGDAKTVVNVGAGTGNYEPDGCQVVAVEPSRTMLAQRKSGLAVQAVAERLPFAAHSFDAAMAVFTVHHWHDRHRGLAELRRVSNRQVLVVYEPLIAHDFWLTDYFPQAAAGQTEADAPTPAEIADHLNIVDVQTMWVPHDCTDGVAAAYWRRPHAYLDPAVQQSMSFLALLDSQARQRGTNQLADDLDSGRWHTRYGHILKTPHQDYGYRLVVAN